MRSSRESRRSLPCANTWPASFRPRGDPLRRLRSPPPLKPRRTSPSNRRRGWRRLRPSRLPTPVPSNPLEPVPSRQSLPAASARRGRAAPDGVLRASRGIPQAPHHLPRRDLRDVSPLLELGAAALRHSGPAGAPRASAGAEPLLHDADGALSDVLPRRALRRTHRGVAAHPLAALALRRAGAVPAREALRSAVHPGRSLLFT